jgi:hypothetical protein
MSIDPKLNGSALKQFLITYLSVALGTVALTILPQSVLAATLYTQTITLSTGWNTVSTPLVLASHVFSAAENSSNFDIYVLDASQTSGWATMAQEGQTEFTPLYGYFIDNKTGINQTLTFSYLASTTPAQRLFERKFTTPGWYSIGVSNPTFALPIPAASSTHTGNVSSVLAALGSNYDTLIDLTDGDSDIQSPTVASSWKAVTPSTTGTLNDLRETKGYGIHVSAAGAIYDGFQNDQVLIATLTVQNAASVASQIIAVNAPNQVLGGFATIVTGAPVAISGLTIGVATSSTGAGLIAAVSIVDENGSVVAGPVDASGTGNLLTFSSSIVFPVGSHTYTIKGKIPATFTNGGSVTLNTSPNGVYSTNGVTAWANPYNQATGVSITLGTTNFTMNTMTVRGATLSVAASQNPAAQNVVVGGQNIVLANIQLDASQSGEDVRVGSIPVNITEGTTDDNQYLTSCVVMDGTTQLNTGSNVLNNTSGSTLNPVIPLDNTLTIPKGTVKTLSYSCNLSSGAPTTANHSIQVGVTSTGWTATGVQSGSGLVLSTNLFVSASNSGTQTFSSGATVTATIDPSSPSYAVQAGGTTGVTVGVIKFRSANEAFNLNKVGLTLANGTYGVTSTGSGGSAAGGGGDLTQVYLYNGSTLLGTATFTGSNTTATSTFSQPLNIPRDTDLQITVKADLAPIGVSAAGGIGNLLTVDPLNFEGTGASSGATKRGGATAGVAGVRLFKSYPTLALDTLSSTGVADGRLIHFKVTTSSAGQIGIAQFKFTIATTTASVTSIALYGFSSPDYSSAISGQGNGGQIGNTLCSSGCTSSNPTLTFAPNVNPVEVPAGQTYYFELRGSVTNVQSGAAVVTKLNGDSSYGTTYNGYNVSSSTVATSSSYFVWSGNSTTTAAMNAASDVDWTNGYSLPGLPSSGLIQTRSN